MKNVEIYMGGGYLVTVSRLWRAVYAWLELYVETFDICPSRASTAFMAMDIFVNQSPN
jgi:hypothetical protein